MSTTVSSAPKVDVVVAGGAFAGLALAIALRQALGEGLSIIVADPATNADRARDDRASAIAAAARRMFDQLGVWSTVDGQAQPISEMIVTDSRLRDSVRPVFLTFAGDVAPGEPFAHMVENKHLLAALADKARDVGVELRATSVTGFDATPGSVTTRFAQGSSVTCRLLVAADGARSRLRTLAGIATHGWWYGQSGIVTTVAHERDHGGRAEEHFLPSGPFAILPLRGNRSSIVWTEEGAAAERMVRLPDELFHSELERRFGLHLGEIHTVSARRAYPLGLFVARSFIAERMALVGDAAHLMHPIAGQGLNMGLRDVAALAQSVADAVRLGLDPGGIDVLERYQRWRRFDTMMMGVATDGLNRLFSNHSDVLRIVRDIGLGLVDRFPPLKNLFIKEAAGMTGEVPKLLRGEAL